jgi:hypothetical protein
VAVDESPVQTFCETPGASCGLVGNDTKGFCTKLYSSNVCRKFCRKSVAADCPTGFVCAHPGPFPAESGVGQCMPALDFDAACNDGGTGTCAECRAKATEAGGCCATQAAACTSDACKAFVDCAMACKRDRPCVEACVAKDAAVADQGTPLFLCLSGFGGPSGAACGDVCAGPAVCGDFDGPDTTSCCKACDGAATCRKNGCFNGFYCNRTTCKCAGPSTLTSCGG